MKNQKTVHTIRGQGWVVECIDEPPDHSKRMSSKQAFDVHRSEARVRPRHYQPVPSQYKGGGSWVRGKKGYGLAVGRRESLFWGFHSNSFGGNILLGWHTAQKKEDELEPLGACHEGYQERIPTLRWMRMPWWTSKQKSFLCLVIGSGTASTSK